MEIRKIISLVVMLCFSAGLMSCATNSQTGALAGAGVGALGGAAINKRDPLAGAFVGAILGAMLGGAAGHFADEQHQSRRDVIKEKKYKPSQGTVIRIEDVSIDPLETYPGEAVKLKTSYYMMCPDSKTTPKVSEKISVYNENNKEIMAPLERETIKEQGLVSSSVSIPISEDAAPGKYTVVTTARTGNNKDFRILNFYVH